MHACPLPRGQPSAERVLRADTAFVAVLCPGLRRWQQDEKRVGIRSVITKTETRGPYSRPFTVPARRPPRRIPVEFASILLRPFVAARGFTLPDTVRDVGPAPSRCTSSTRRRPSASRCEPALQFDPWPLVPRRGRDALPPRRCPAIPRRAGSESAARPRRGGPVRRAARARRGQGVCKRFSDFKELDAKVRKAFKNYPAFFPPDKASTPLPPPPHHHPTPIPLPSFSTPGGCC